MRFLRVANLLTIISLAALHAAGCGGRAELEVDAGSAPDSGVMVGSLFDPDRVLEVELELDPADWNALRAQTRSYVDILTGDCQAAPHPNPFTYFRGDLTVDGTRVSDVAVRKKGFMGSLDPDRPSLRFKLDAYIPDQRLLGRDDLVLNNSVQDGSYIKQCLGFGVFAAAGLPASRCNFAHVVVNGEDLGVYVHVERVDRDFLRHHFADATGNLYEGTFSDFRPGWLDTFEISTNRASADGSEVAALASALEAPDDELVAEVAGLVDLDRFIDYWVIESVLHHKDGYTANANNFHVYADPTSGKLVFLPYGLDQSMEVRESPHVSMTRTFSRALLAKRLLDNPQTRARYMTRMDEVLDAVWDPAVLGAEVDRMRALIEPWAGPPYATATGWELGYETDLVKTFIDTRAAQIRTELAGAFESGVPKETVCWPDIGAFTARFTTTEGTLEDDIFAAGTGTLELEVNGVLETGTIVGARAGMAADGYWYVIQIDARMADQSHLLAEMAFFRTQPSLGSTAIDWVSNHARLYRGNAPASYDSLVGYLGPATLRLEQVAPTAGAPIVGSLTGRVAVFPPY